MANLITRLGRLLERREPVKHSSNDRANFNNVSLQLSQIDTEDYRNAILKSLSVTNPSNRELMSIYNRFALSEPYTIERRRISHEIFSGTFDSTNQFLQSEIIDTIWFKKLIDIIIDSEFYGFSLIYFIFDKQGKVINCYNYDRTRVLPRYNKIQNVSDSGTYLLDYTPIDKTYREVINPKFVIEGKNIIALYDSNDDENMFGMFAKLAIPLLQYDSLMESAMLYNATKRNPTLLITNDANPSEEDQNALYSQLEKTAHRDYLVLSRGYAASTLNLNNTSNSGLDVPALSTVTSNIQKIINGIEFGSNNNKGSFAREKVYSYYLAKYQKMRIEHILTVLNTYLKGLLFQKPYYRGVRDMEITYTPEEIDIESQT